VKFCTVIKTTKCCLWVVQILAPQIKDAKRPPSSKIIKLLYLGNGLTDFYTVWHDDTELASGPGPTDR